MIYPQSIDIGRRVHFRRYRGALPELGVLTSIEKGWVMVKYDTGASPLATRPEALEWADEGVTRSDGAPVRGPSDV